MHAMRVRIPRPKLMDSVSFDKIPYGDRVYVLVSGKLVARYEVTGDGDHTLTASRYSIFTYGETYEEARDAFYEFFDHQYRSLVECPEDDLALSALTVRALYEALVERIDTSG
jgi:hypothetical protein